MKIKEVEIDGEKFKIGKFNCLQVEEMIEQESTEDRKVLITRMWSLIATALANGGDERLTDEDGTPVVYDHGKFIEATNDLKICLSLEQRGELHRELLEFNGLSVKPAGESKGTDGQ